MREGGREGGKEGSIQLQCEYFRLAEMDRLQYSKIDWAQPSNILTIYVHVLLLPLSLPLLSPSPLADVPALSVKRDKSNNYASIDCGAKVVAQNPEAQNPDAVLKENKDFYLLNPCSVDIWWEHTNTRTRMHTHATHHCEPLPPSPPRWCRFVIEMCDFVAVHTIEIASFELFSSMPRDFGVYSSEG